MSRKTELLRSQVKSYNLDLPCKNHVSEVARIYQVKDSEAVRMIIAYHALPFLKQLKHYLSYIARKKWHKWS